MNIEYYTNDNITMVCNTFSIKDMLNTLLNHELINEITEDYSQDITDMCNNCTLILSAHLKQFIEIDKIIVCEGVFNMMGNHTWIKIDDTIFDLTLAQFIPNAPKLAVLKENNYYQQIRQFTLNQWIEQLFT